MSETHPQAHEDYHNEIKKKVTEHPDFPSCDYPMKLSAELADIVGKGIASRSECIKKMWDYLKMNNLQDPYNRQYLMPLWSIELTRMAFDQLLDIHLKP